MKLELRDVRHVYSPGTDFEVAALRGVSLSVEEGEVLGIVGGTGSGKSTLVQHMNLLLEPTGGEVFVDGVGAATLKKSELRRRIGLVFQFPEQSLFAPSVEEDVGFAPRQLGLHEDQVRERVREVLDLLGIGHLADRSPHSLSGGEKRRVAIAGVLAMEPEVLVLDEPTAGLDPATREELLGVVRDLRHRGTSVVLVSHDLDEVAEIADRICVMAGGEVRAIGRPAEVFYGNPGIAPATVRVGEALRAACPAFGTPVRFEETLAALKELLEEPR
ncbi:MAG: energy-coupling factor ABC transporter ATP-binding protein [Rubrobacteraceae bacterium]